MGIRLNRLRPSPTRLKGFSSEAIKPAGSITLLVTMGQGDNMVRTMTDFFITKAQSSYNAILGRPSLNNLKVVTSTYHLKMNFPTKVDVGEVRGEQILRRECYVQELKVAMPSILVIEDSSKRSSSPPPVLLTRILKPGMKPI